MVAVYCQDDLQRAMVARTLIGLPVSTTGSRAEFEDRVQRACSAVVVLPDLEDDEALTWFRDLRRKAPHAVRVLVTRFTPSNAVRLLEMKESAHAVWLHEVDPTLARMVGEILRTDGVGCLARIIRGGEETAPELCRGLVRACLSRRLPRTVAGLCTAAGLEEHRLRYLWRRHVTPGSSPGEMVDWLLLGWAFRCKGSLGSWARVAATLGVKEDTLRAVCVRRTGLTPSQLQAEGVNPLQDRFRAWWGERLMG